MRSFLLYGNLHILPNILDDGSIGNEPAFLCDVLLRYASIRSPVLNYAYVYTASGFKVNNPIAFQSENIGPNLELDPSLIITYHYCFILASEYKIYVLESFGPFLWLLHIVCVCVRDK